MRGWLAGLVLAVALGTAACGGSKPASIPNATDARADRDVSQDGAAKSSMTVTVQFDAAVHAAGGKVPFASHFELSVPTIQGGNDRVFVKSAGIDGQTVMLAVDRILPTGTKLTIGKSAFDEHATGDMTVDVASAFSPVMAILAVKAVLPTDPDIVPAKPVIPPVKPEDKDAAAQRQVLKSMLQQHGAPSDVINQALSRFDAVSTEIVPSPKMRAAIAALTGTFAEPAIDSLLTSNNCTGKPASLIAFQVPPDAEEFIGRVTYAIGGQRVVSINPKLEGERLDRIMPILAHEAIHCDKSDTKTEEAAAVAFETFLYVQLLSSDPTLAHGGTAMSHEQNVNAIAFINSGRRYPESVGILPSPGVARVLPGSDSKYGSFGELVVAAYSTADSAVPQDETTAVAYVARLAKAANLAPQSPFNIRFLDELLGAAMDPKQLQQAISALSAVPAD